MSLKNQPQIIYKPSIITDGDKSRVTFTYDSNGKEICNIEEKFRTTKFYPFEGSLCNEHRTECSYDSNGNLSNELWQSWNKNAWENSNRITYILDDNGNLLKVLWQLWSNNVWVNSARTNYTLDSYGNRLKELYEVWVDNSWINSGRSHCTLDNNGNPILEIAEQYNNDKWTNSIKTEYIYDSDGNLQSYMKSRWDNFMKVKWDKDSWLCDYRKTDSYDHNKKLLSSEVIMGYGENSRKHNTNFIYNSTGILLSQEDEINNTKYITEYTYDTNGNCVNVDCDLSTFLRLSINCHISYNNGNSLYKLPLYSNSQVTIEYVSFLL